MYTDGSKLDDQTGSGVAVYKGNTEIRAEWYRLPQGTSVFQAEITAISKAAEVLTEAADTSMRFVKIFVDSQAAIMALGNTQVRSRAVEEAIDRLNVLADLVTSVTIVWIPAHKGYEGNERADVLAKRGSEETSLDRAVSVRNPVATVKGNIREGVLKEWREEWTNSDLSLIHI